MKRVAVIGAGITGLCAAHELKRRGVTVSVFEKSARAGGLVQSAQAGGYTLESGPNTVLAGGAIWDELIDTLGLRGRLLVADARARKRFIARDGRLVSVPGNPLTTPILSAGAKWRLSHEPFIRRRPADRDDESLADFARRRCGPEFLDYLVNPMVSGIYAGTPEGLSTRYAFPFLWDAEGVGGSLTAGLLRKIFAGRCVRKKMISFPNGLQELTDQLALTLGDALRLNAGVTRLRKSGGEWWLSVSGSAEWRKFDAVIETVPLHSLASAANDGLSRARLELFAGVPYAPVRVLQLGFDQKDVPHPLDGFGFLLPEREHQDLLGILFASSLFPSHAPAGKVLLTVMLGGMRSPSAADWPPARALTAARAALRQYLGVSAGPELVHETTHPAAIPQLGLGYGEVLGELEKYEAADGDLHLAGNFRGGISVLNCIESGVRLARGLV
ncbi:MAG: protoporphyrinogen oxidase [Verrucomicrobiales bacterium]|jgi:oxygen-dependent protoporphyrinogen oxidase|nr:protoporphyrinogen oxidase [Verrucomicrobiales bacterium]